MEPLYNGVHSILSIWFKPSDTVVACNAELDARLTCASQGFA